MMSSVFPASVPSGITDAELRFAQLKLAAFNALIGWGRKTGEPIKIGEREFRAHEPFTIEERMRIADQLVTWTLTAPSETIPPVGRGDGWRADS
jgi:hypothetical protein